MVEVTKKVLVEVPSLLWADVQDRAKAEGRFVRAVVVDALRQYVSGVRGGGSVAVSAPTSADTLRDLVNTVKPGAVRVGSELPGVDKRRLEAERIARQNYYRENPEAESQDPDDNKEPPNDSQSDDDPDKPPF
jgi:hypothetical protein